MVWPPPETGAAPPSASQAPIVALQARVPKLVQRRKGMVDVAAGGSPAGRPLPATTDRLWPLAAYFLWLGTTGVGGATAVAAYMQRDLVERRRWIGEDDYRTALALAQVLPGPLTPQLAMIL